MTIEQRLAEIIVAFCADARPGRVGLGAAAADTLAGGWPTRHRSRREKALPPWLPTVAQALVSTVNQAAELRLCSNPPQPYARVVILAAQKAANRHK
jgi:hypothetical protein